jgi:hypothetical protein
MHHLLSHSQILHFGIQHIVACTAVSRERETNNGTTPVAIQQILNNATTGLQ